MREFETIEVRLGQRSYSIEIGAGCLSQMGKGVSACDGVEKAAVITDSGVPEPWLETAEDQLARAGLQVCRMVFPQGEPSKTIGTAGTLLEGLAESGFHRNDLVVAVGGGVVGDVAGFVAATYMRGIRLIQCPTTLLAMVDSSVGGKTGVNLHAGKNLAGAFYQPVWVFADLDVLETLPDPEARCGLAEMVKYGFIAEPSILDVIADWDTAASVRGGARLDAIVKSVKCKAAIVERDETESGDRAFLNFGHTLGHAIETASAHRYSHGEAVSIGMVFALALGREMGLGDYVSQAIGVLSATGLQVRAAGLDRAAVRSAMERDKKFDSGLRFVLIEAPGRPLLVSNVDDESIGRALAEVGIT